MTEQLGPFNLSYIAVVNTRSVGIWQPPYTAFPGVMMHELKFLSACVTLTFDLSVPKWCSQLHVQQEYTEL